jgi:hypothetical protein
LPQSPCEALAPDVGKLDLGEIVGPAEDYQAGFAPNDPFGVVDSLAKNCELKGYCELKSPRDDWIFAVPKDLKPGEIREESQEDPTAHALARVIGKAAAQFDAVNPDHAQPNILVIMSHARLRGPADLHLAIGGLAVPNGDRLFLLVDPNEKNFQKAWEKQQKLWEDARKIDLFYWIDAHTKTVRHVINKDGLRHLEARDLMNVAA